MNSKRSAIFSMVAILVAVVLFAGIPMVADHQAFASGKGSSNLEKALHRVFVGPCAQGDFMYLVCAKTL
ncbi:MAG: hypothetical protein WAM14_25305 [Candidatus Nitrosopolaris sp.]